MNNDDLALAGTPKAVKISGGMLALAGGFGVLHVIQIWFSLVFLVTLPLVLWIVMTLAAIACVVFGIGFSRARSWAVWPSIPSAAVLWLVGAGWFVYAFVHGYLNLFGFIVPFLSFVAIISLAFSVSSCMRTARARERLSSEGIDLGV